VFPTEQPTRSKENVCCIVKPHSTKNTSYLHINFNRALDYFSYLRKIFFSLFVSFSVLLCTLPCSLYKQGSGTEIIIKSLYWQLPISYRVDTSRLLHADEVQASGQPPCPSTAFVLVFHPICIHPQLVTLRVRQEKS
jgi:hypothetical protein